jgi:uncharacterized protein YcfJ
MHRIIIALAVALFGTSAQANQSYTVQGKVVQIQPVYTQVSVQKPSQHCRNVEVPIYGRTGGGNAGEGALGGMIIGGVLGKVLGGNDKGAAAGAILGGVVGANNSQGQRVITGYRSERQCTTKYHYVQESRVNEYDLTYLVEGKRVTFRVNRSRGENAYINQRRTIRIGYQLLN